MKVLLVNKFHYRKGGSETYYETTLAVQKRLSGGPVSLRLGYKLSSDEVFAGFSINTF